MKVFHHCVLVFLIQISFRSTVFFKCKCAPGIFSFFLVFFSFCLPKSLSKRVLFSFSLILDLFLFWYFIYYSFAFWKYKVLAGAQQFNLFKLAILSDGMRILVYSKNIGRSKRVFRSQVERVTQWKPNSFQ